jgi:hypothetical protein
LYNSYQESEYNRFVLEAKLRGVDIEGEVEKKEEKQTFMFKDPKEYEKMPKEERERLTNEMLGRHKGQFKL